MAIPTASLFFSKEYTTTVNVAASGKSTEQFISEKDYLEYGPFDTISILNTDSIELAVLLDQNPDRRVKVPPNSIRNGDGQKFNSFCVENLDGSTAHTAGKIRVLVENTLSPRRT